MEFLAFILKSEYQISARPILAILDFKYIIEHIIPRQLKSLVNNDKITQTLKLAKISIYGYLGLLAFICF